MTNERKELMLPVLALLISTSAFLPACAPREPRVTEPETSTPPAETPTETPTEDEPGSLYNQLQADEYRTWAAAPGYAEPQSARGPHGERVQLRLNEVAEKALTDGESAWPEGSIIAKDVWVGDQLANIAVMQKRGDRWFFGEWDESGDVIAEGEAIQPCQGCHRGESDGTLGVSLGK